MSGGNPNGHYDPNSNIYDNNAMPFSPYGNLPAVPAPQPNSAPAQAPPQQPPLQIVPQPIDQALSFVPQEVQQTQHQQPSLLPSLPHSSPIIPSTIPTTNTTQPTQLQQLPPLMQTPQSTDFIPQTQPVPQPPPTMLPPTTFNTNPIVPNPYQPMAQAQPQYNPNPNQNPPQQHQSTAPLPTMPNLYQQNASVNPPTTYQQFDPNQSSSNFSQQPHQQQNNPPPQPQPNFNHYSHQPPPQPQPQPQSYQHPPQPLYSAPVYHNQPQSVPQQQLYHPPHQVPQRPQAAVPARSYRNGPPVPEQPVYRYKHAAVTGGMGNAAAAQPFVASQQVSLTYRLAHERNRKLADKTKRPNQKQYRITPINHQSVAYSAILRHANPTRVSVPIALTTADQHRRSIRTNTTDDSDRFEGNDELQACYKYLQKLMLLDERQIFSQPVNPELHGCPDYFKVIKNPMDLGTIRKDLLDGNITSAEQFKSLVNLVFANAMTFNPSHHEIHKLANELRNRFQFMLTQQSSAQPRAPRVPYNAPPQTAPRQTAAPKPAKPRPSAASSVPLQSQISAPQGPTKRTYNQVEESDEHPAPLPSNPAMPSFPDPTMEQINSMMQNPTMMALMYHQMMQQQTPGAPNNMMMNPLMMLPNMLMTMPPQASMTMPPQAAPKPPPKSRTGAKKQRHDDPLASGSMTTSSSVIGDSISGQPLLPPPIPLAPGDHQAAADPIINDTQIDQLQELAGALSDDGVDLFLDLLREFIPNLDPEDVDVSTLTVSQFNRAVQYAERLLTNPAPDNAFPSPYDAQQSSEHGFE